MTDANYADDVTLAPASYCEPGLRQKDQFHNLDLKFLAFPFHKTLHGMLNTRNDKHPAKGARYVDCAQTIQQYSLPYLDHDR